MAKSKYPTNIKALTPKCVLEASSQEVGVGGVEAASLKMTNESGERTTFKHMESGFARLETEGKLEITVGEKAPEGPCIVLHTPNGDFDISVKDGVIGLKGTSIVLDATEQITMKAATIQIGDAKETSQIVFAATEITGKCKSGNLAAALKTDSMLTAFARSFVTDQVESVITGVAGAVA